MENKVFFEMDAVRFGKIVAFIKETCTYDHQFDYDGPYALGQHAANAYRSSARWVVSETAYGYKIRDKKEGRETDFHEAEAVAAYLEGIFYLQ